MIPSNPPRRQHSTNVVQGAAADPVLRATQANERGPKDSRERAERLRCLVENAADAFFVLDPDGRFIDVNQRACDYSGYSREELLAMSQWDLAEGFTPEKFRALVTEMASSGPLTVENFHRRKNGTIYPVEIRACLFESRGQQLVLGLVRDVTERTRMKQALKQHTEKLEELVEERTAKLSEANAILRKEIAEREEAERALRESEARFRTLVEHAPEALLVMDVDTGRFVDVNDHATRLFGLERAALLRVGPADLSPATAPDGRPTSEWAREKLREAMEGRNPVFEWIHRSAEGRDIPCEVRLVRLPASARNLVRGSVTDITDRKRAEEALRRYAKRLETLQEIDRAILVAQSPDAIAQAALGHIRQLIPYRRASVAVFDFESGEGELYAVDARGIVKLTKGTRVPLEAFGSTESLRQGSVNRVDDALTLPQTSVVEALRTEGLRSWITVPLRSQGELIGSLNIAWDTRGGPSLEEVDIAREVADTVAIAIHQARLREQALSHAAELERRVAERTAELEAFSYSVSHDLRTPLRAIDGFARILLQDQADKLDPEGQRLLRVICTSTVTMGQLIDDLLAFSHLGRSEMHVCDVNMTDLARAAFDELTATHPDRRLQLKSQPLPPARGDRAMLRQVFLNLLSNAIKFTRPRDTAVIEVGVEATAGGAEYYVRDNGVGFDMRYAPKLFGVFQRLHCADEFEGTGVGLAIVQRVVQRHGGSVRAEGRVDAGATIYFSLPRGKTPTW